jgi:hypothetical protein
MAKTVEVLLSRRVTIGIGEAAGDHAAGAKVTVGEDIADSIVTQGAGAVVVAEKPVKAAKKSAEPEATETAAPEAAPAAAAGVVDADDGSDATTA